MAHVPMNRTRADMSRAAGIRAVTAEAQGAALALPARAPDQSLASTRVDAMARPGS